MAEAVPAGLSPREGRKFGLILGGAFLLLAGVSRWRGHDLAPYVLGGLGLALVLAGVAVPRWLGPVQRAWLRLGLALSKVTTPIFMALVYFVVLTPTGVLMRLLGKNPLRRRDANGGLWVARKPDQEQSLTRQF